MQAQQINSTYDVSRRSPRGPQSRLLLVGSEDVFKSGLTHHIFCGRQFEVAGRSATLLDGLARLETESIDLVLLSYEFREEELSLFAFDAHRRGFAGLILRVASLPAETARVTLAAGGLLPDRRIGRLYLEAESQPEVRAAPTLIGSRDSISLTKKEQAVLTRVSEGWSNQQIARHLHCSEGSVKAILQQLFKKLGVRKRAQIVRLAFEKTLVQPQTTHPDETVESPSHGSEGGLPNGRLAPAGNPNTISEKGNPIHIGDFVIDVKEHRVWVRGVESHLTPQEFRLLTFFSRHPRRLLSHNDLVEALWNKQPASRESLRVIIQAVRDKIEPTTRPRYIVTQPYHGYRFIPSL